MIRTMTIATMLLLAVPASAKPAPAGMSPLRMDVAGVRLAMPIEQAGGYAAGGAGKHKKEPGQG